MESKFDNIKTALLNVGLAEHNADWNWKKVRSPFIRIYLVTDGDAWVEAAEEKWHLTAGHLFLIPAYLTHSYVCTGKFIHYYAHIYEYPHSWLRLNEKFVKPMLIEAPPLSLQLYVRLAEMFPSLRLKHSDPRSYDNHGPRLLQNIQFFKQCPLHAVIESSAITSLLVSYFLAHFGGEAVSVDNHIDAAVKYINSHIQSAIDLDNLAHEVCLSKSHFIRRFKEVVGITPMKYINKKKIEQAEQMLILDDIPIKNIAYRLGFDDYNYFFRVFKHFTGKTPLTYRNQ